MFFLSNSSAHHRRILCIAAHIFFIRDHQLTQTHRIVLMCGLYADHGTRHSATSTVQSGLATASPDMSATLPDLNTSLIASTRLSSVTQLSPGPDMTPNILSPPRLGVPRETTEINRDFSGLLTSPVDYLESGSLNLVLQALTKWLKILLSFAPRTKVTQSPLLLLFHKTAISLRTLFLWLQNDKSQQPTSDTNPQVAFRDQGQGVLA
jgi:hypothetical protein